MATDNNNRELQQLEELLATYDERGLQLIRDYLKTHNAQTQANKSHEHRTVREILDEVHALQHHAARMGQVHIVDHHRGTPHIFIAAPRMLLHWINGQVLPLAPLPTVFPSTGPMHAMDRISYMGADEQKREYINMVAGRNQIIDLSITKPVRSRRSEIPQTTVHDLLHVHPNGYFLSENVLDMHLVTFRDGQTNSGTTTIIRHTYSSVNIPGGIGTHRTFRGRMTFDLSGEQLYIADPGKGIRRVNVSHTKPTVTNLYDRFPLKAPIDIAFDQNLRLLIVQDAIKRIIYGALVDKQQSYPCFKDFSQALQLPESALPNAASFTYSCWLKRGANQSSNWKRQLPDSLLGFYISEDHKEVIIHYHADGQPQTTSFAAPIPASDWFHFSWIKRDGTFEFFIDDWSHTIPAPDRIDLNRELPGKEHPLLFCVPGYLAAEVNTWAYDLPVKDLRAWRRNWITGAPPGLMGYWHLQVSNQEVLWGDASPVFQDASGHDHTITGHHMTWQLAASPLDALLPLYYLHEKELSQGLGVDTPAGQVYWCERLNNGHTRLMRGSTMGHTMPVVLTEMDHPVVDLHVESGTNDAFEELVLAHARRRKAMQDAIQSAATALEQHALDVDAGHDQAANAHANLQDRMIELTRNRDELVKLLQSYKEKLDDAHRAEKQSERKGGQARREAIDAARKLVADAHLQAAAIRREGGQALIDGHQQPQ